MIIKKNKLKINLKDKLHEMEVYNETPFIHFSQRDFLDSESYGKLCQEINNINDFDYIFKGRGEKAKKTINGSSVSNVKSGILSDFCFAILDQKFYEWFIATHLKFYRSKKFKLYSAKPNQIRWRIFAKINRILNLPFSIYYTEIEYSSIKRGCDIPPHTDEKSKRLSFVYYMPTPNVHLTKELKNSLGTVIWKAREDAEKKLDRFDCALLGVDEQAELFKNYEISNVSDFEANKIFGFIKSEKSWHGVIKNENSYDRRAIVINIYEMIW